LLLLAFEQQVLQEQDGGRKDGALMNAFGLKEHIATCSHLYDNVLAFASTSVDTAFSDGAEDEKSLNIVEPLWLLMPLLTIWNAKSIPLLFFNHSNET